MILQVEQPKTEIKTKQLRASAYLRVSTDEQAKEGYGLVYQIEKIKNYVELRDFKLDDKHIYRDDGYSGTLPPEKRPALKRLLEDAEKKEFDIVLVYKIDRLARKLLITLETIHKLGELGVEFSSITENFDTANPFGRYMMGMMGGMAELERDTIRDRTLNGKISAAKTGKWVTGIPPYGYKVDKKTRRLQTVPKEAEVIRKFYHWLIEERISLREIERRANLMGLPAPKHNTIKSRVTSNKWFKRTITKILTNEIYTGEWYFRKYKRPFKYLESLTEEENLRSKDLWIPMTSPVIISKETFQRSKEQLLRNKENARRNQKRDYMFSKMIYCGQCNHKMFAGYQPPKKGNRETGTKYYHGVYRTQTETGATKRCLKCLQCSESRLEPIWEAVKDVLKNPKNIWKPLSNYAFPSVSQDAINKKIGDIERQLLSLGKRKKKIADLYIEDENMDKKYYLSLIGQCDKEEKVLKYQLCLIEKSRVTKTEKTEQSKVISELYEKIKTRLENAEYEEKTAILNMVIDRVIIFPKQNYADVVLRFPCLSQDDEKVDKSETNPMIRVKIISENQCRRKRIDRKNDK